jgi:hypothetical protein
MRALGSVFAIVMANMAVTPAAADVNLIVTGNDAVRIDFTFTGTEFAFYRFSFNNLSTAITGFDPGEAYRLEVFDSANNSLGLADINNRSPFLNPPATVSSYYGILSAVGTSSFAFSPGYAASNIFGKISSTNCDDLGGFGCRRVGGPPQTVNISGFSLNSGGEGGGGEGGGGTGAVPEPASWAMLIAGFGLVGAMMRRRRLALA